MAHIFVRNSLNTNFAVKLNTTFIKTYDVADGGESKWVMEVATTYPSSSGTKILPRYIDVFDKSITNIDQVIENSVSEIATEINWAPFVVDNTTPCVIKTVPEDNTTVDINSNIYMGIKDTAPSAGIDMSSAKIIINNGAQDFDITSECKITGTPFYFNIEWVPPMREYRTYVN